MHEPIMSIDIKGYCSLKDVFLQLKPGVTVITGASNVGKSSLIKAVNQCLFNPTGSTFINNEMEKCKIEVLYNGHNITFKRGTKTSATYNIDGVELEKVVGQPNLIADIGFTKGNLTSSDVLNFWEQMGLPFLIHSTPKDRYEILSNGVSGLEEVRDLMQSDLKEVNEDLLRKTTLLQATESDLNRLRTLLLPEDTRKMIETKFTSATNNFNHYKVLFARLVEVSNTQSAITNLETNIQNYTFIPEAKLKFEALQTKANNLQDLNLKLEGYKTLFTLVVDLEREVSTLEQEKLTLEGTLRKCNVCPLCGTVGVDLLKHEGNSQVNS